MIEWKIKKFPEQVRANKKLKSDEQDFWIGELEKSVAPNLPLRVAEKIIDR